MAIKLTLKQRKFIKAYIKTGNATQAAKDAGYNCRTEETFAKVGSENLRKLEGKMCQVLVEAGVDNATLAKKVQEGLDALVVKPFAHPTPKGFIVKELTYVDFPTRAKYLEIVSKMKGLLKEKVEKQVSGTVTIRVKGKDVKDSDK